MRDKVYLVWASGLYGQPELRAVYLKWDLAEQHAQVIRMLAENLHPEYRVKDVRVESWDVLPYVPDNFDNPGWYVEMNLLTGAVVSAWPDVRRDGVPTRIIDVLRYTNSVPMPAGEGWERVPTHRKPSDPDIWIPKGGQLWVKKEQHLVTSVRDDSREDACKIADKLRLEVLGKEE